MQLPAAKKQEWEEEIKKQKLWHQTGEDNMEKTLYNTTFESLSTHRIQRQHFGAPMLE
jgi:hypothetical protein